MPELETKEGEILIFATEDDLVEYVLSRMVERGEIVPVARDSTGELIVRAQK